VAFGGPDLKTLFIPSARFGLPPDRSDHPDEGALFAIDLDIAGRPANLFDQDQGLHRCI